MAWRDVERMRQLATDGSQRDLERAETEYAAAHRAYARARDAFRRARAGACR